METVKFRNKEYKVLERFRSKKILVERDNKMYVLVPFVDIEALKKFLVNKRTLKKNKVEMARVLKVDKKALLVKEEYIAGESLLSIIAMNRLTADDYTELFRVYRNNRFAQILLNYKPENFVKRGKYFYYVGNEIIASRDGIAFERGDDILLWINTEVQRRYVLARGYSYLGRNLFVSSGEIKKQIALLCAAYW